MRIGELAERTGISARSLRYYEQQGLLPSRRAPNGYRDFDESAVVRARNIKDLIDTGLTVEDVRQYAANGCLDRPLTRCAAELDTTRRRLAELDRRIERLRRIRARLAAYHSAVEDHAARG
ncbi:MerR family transcriptional regulator [Thermostaphylospora chromogena]|uniref:DNA-binding transcriptional regulator, MerR family n=1 Tax=Thermostaphylospora chromogena TaxID=35622 RepID=A0A1H1H4H5_9ACTN|nr:MerR family transcriptional regulator [Thermostaphylospora chromogena]SDR20324.1 DNA-binding transcriptional regulator, MerR family [Thermostaphylospora chromogena]